MDEVNGAYEVLVKMELARQEGGGRVRKTSSSNDHHAQQQNPAPVEPWPEHRLCWRRRATRIHRFSGPTSRGNGTSRTRRGPENPTRSQAPRLPGRDVRGQARPGSLRGVPDGRAPRPDALEYGGRLYNRAPRSRIEFLHSFDDGRTWQSYSLTNTAPPWDVIHYETVEEVPAAMRSVLFKYRLHGPDAGRDACSLYAVSMEEIIGPLTPRERPSK